MRHEYAIYKNHALQNAVGDIENFGRNSYINKNSSYRM